MNDEHLVRFTFDLIDEDRSGYLSREEVYDLILLMSKLILIQGKSRF